LAAQSYGLPREVEDYLETRLYIPEEFPLLDQVYRTNKLIHVALDGSYSQPSEWEVIIPEDYDNYSLLSEDLTLNKKSSGEYEPSINGQSFTEEVLRHEGNFLYAFPLSVKGSVLGIFLAEEA